MVHIVDSEDHCINCPGAENVKRIEISHQQWSTSFALCKKCRSALSKELLREDKASETPKKLLSSEFVSIADQTIGLFLEYRDVHGYPEDQAKDKAVQEVREGCDLTDDVILACQPSWLQNMLKTSITGLVTENGEVTEF